MAYTEQDLATLDKAIATGAREVQYSDHRKVVFQNIDQMLQLRRFIERQIGLSEPPRAIIAEHQR